MSLVLEVLDSAGIERRRGELLSRAGMSANRMRELAEKFKLDQEGQAILRQLDELDFLSGE